VTDRTDPGGGGLTGATGDLTPDETDESFVPAERREIEDAGPTLATSDDNPQPLDDPPAPAHPAVEHGRPSPRIGGDEVTEGEERF